MATNKEDLEKKSKAIINGAIIILNKLPDLDKIASQYVTNTANDAIEYLVDILLSIKGYNWLINIIGKFMAKAEVYIDPAIKAAILYHMRNIFSCSVIPIITDDLIKNGISFDLHEIDILNKFSYSPFDKELGYQFYFDLEEVDKPDDLIYCNDMDALLWYVINKSTRRLVWKPTKWRKKDDEFRKDYPYEQTTTITEDGKEKVVVNQLKLRDGIITFEYNGSSKVFDAYGTEITYQVPSANTLHVFFGDTRENIKNSLVQEILGKENEIKEKDSENEILSTNIKDYQNQIDKQYEYIDQLGENFHNCKITQKEYEHELKKANRKIKSLETKISILEKEQKLIKDVKNELQTEIAQFVKEKATTIGTYFPFMLIGKKHRNYFYGKTLLEFDADYLYNTQLFSSKTLFSQFISSLCKVPSVNLNLSYRQQIIKSEIKKMVEKINKGEDVTISDCFFTFSNEDYDEMYRESELAKAGFTSINGNEISPVTIDAESILSNLNNINSNSTQEEVQTVITGVCDEISKQLSNTQYSVDSKVNTSISYNLVEHFWKTMEECLAATLFTPKLYILYLINLKLAGQQQPNFNIEGLISQFSQMFAQLIRQIRDIFIKFLKDEVMDLLKDLVNGIKEKFGIEQARYYAKLLKQLYDAFRKAFNNGTLVDFSIDDVDYADIFNTSEEEEPSNSNCQ